MYRAFIYTLWLQLCKTSNNLFLRKCVVTRFIYSCANIIFETLHSVRDKLVIILKVCLEKTKFQKKILQQINIDYFHYWDFGNYFFVDFYIFWIFLMKINQWNIQNTI